MKHVVTMLFIIGVLTISFLVISDDVEANITSTVFTGTDVHLYETAQRKLVRQSNGTLWCAFHENSHVHVAWSEDNGVTWNDREIYDTKQSLNPSICVDSNDVVHFVFYSYKNDNDDWQLEYTNSTDWTVFKQIRNQDKEHTQPAIAVDSNDDLHIVYEKGEEGTSNDDQVAYIQSTRDTAGNWGTEQILTDEITLNNDTWNPSIAINSTDGIHVVFMCENHFEGKDDILHMRSSDYGATWTDWEEDPIYEDAVHDQQFPVIAIDDNDVMHVVWTGNSQNTWDQIGYSYNDSGNWTDNEWITWDPSRFNNDGSISVNDNDYIHITYTASFIAKSINHSVNDTTGFTEDISLNGDYSYPNMIGTQWPVINGLKTNRPRIGYAFVCVFTNTNITYYSSDDLTWEVASINITKTGNISFVDIANASTGVNVNYTYNISNTGNTSLSNIVMNETWFDCSCSNWSYTLISTTFNTSNITWYNSSCYAIFNIPDIPINHYYNFSMIINITRCSPFVYGYINNYANVTSNETFTTSSASHSIRWQTLIATTNLRVDAEYLYTDIGPNAEILFTIVGVLIILVSIFIVIAAVYTSDREERY